MQYKRKRTTRRRPKRIVRRRTMNISRPRMRMGQVSIQRTFWLENWSLSTASTNGFWRYYAPSVSQLPSIAEFTAVFDQYKVNGVKLTFRPRYDSFGGENTTDTTLPGLSNQAGNKVHVVIDPMSNVGPTGTYTSATLNTFLENGRVKSYSGTRDINIFYKPRIAMAGQGINDQQRVGPRFLSLGNASTVFQNGVHVFLQDINLTGQSGQSYDVFVTYYMQFRGTK